MMRLSFSDVNATFLRSKTTTLLAVGVMAAVFCGAVGVMELRSGEGRLKDQRTCAGMLVDIVRLNHLVPNAPDARRSVPTTLSMPYWRPLLIRLQQEREELRAHHAAEMFELDGALNALAASLERDGIAPDLLIERVFVAVSNIAEHMRNVATQRRNFTIFLSITGLAGAFLAFPYSLAIARQVYLSQRTFKKDQADRDAAVERFTSLFAGLPIACLTFDRSGNILLWNAAAEMVFGRSAIEVIGKPVSGIVARPGQDSLTGERIEKALSGEEQLHQEWEYRAPDRSLRSLLGSLFPLRDTEDEIIGGVIATIDITERKQAERRLRSIVEGARCILWEADVYGDATHSDFHWNMRIWNEDTAQQVLPLDTTSRCYVDAWMDSRMDDQPRMHSTSCDALRTGKPGYTQEFLCRNRFGVSQWMAEHTQIEQVEPGHWHVTGIAVDISARKRTEERLDEVLSGLRTILWDGTVEKEDDSDHITWRRVTFWNPDTAKQILPLDAPDGDFVAAMERSRLPEDRERMNALSEQAILGGQPGYWQEFRCRDRDGRIHWMREDALIRPHGPGRWDVAGVCREITERKTTEERLSNVLEKARCILWDATVVYENDALHWDLHVWNEETAQEIVPLEPHHGSFVWAWSLSRPKEDDLRIGQNAREAFLSGRNTYSQEYRTVDRFGMTHWLSEDVRIQPTGEGRWRAVGVCVDITDRKRTEERLQAMTEELSRSNAALQDFASIASHDLKEPLRKIQTFGSMLTRKADTLTPDARGYLDRMIGASARMQSLIDGLMAYSRVTSKGNAFAPTDLNDVLNGVLSDLEVRIHEARAQVCIDRLPTVAADELQMRQLFQNLIGNALKFHRDSDACRVEIRHQKQDGKHIITVSDNGIGFAPKDAERIFEIFERLDGSEREGTGVGLAICRKIVERHGGTIVATGTPGVGARFTITLP